MEPGRHERTTEGTRSAAPDAGREHRSHQHAVGGEQETRHDRGRVEHMARDVVERSEAGEVQVPPQRVARAENGDRHADREREERSSAEVMRGVARDRRHGRPVSRTDGVSFGGGEEQAHGLTICGCDDPSTVPCPQAGAVVVVARRGQESPGQRRTAATMVMGRCLRTHRVCRIRPGFLPGDSATLDQSALDTALCADGFVSPRGRWWRRLPSRRPSSEWPPADDSPGCSTPP